MPLDIPLPDFPQLRGPYLRDLLAQPAALADTLVTLNGTAPLPQAARRLPRIVLTGMGSSLHALHPLQIQLSQAGRASQMIETSELIHSQPALVTDQTLLVIVSQSGRSAESTLLLDKVAALPGRPFVVGVTNTPDSPLATRSDFVVPVRAGVEFSVSCKTYVSTLLALEWLGASLVGAGLPALSADLQLAAPAVDAYLRDMPAHVRRLMSDLKDLRHLFVTGRGTSLAAVGTGGLILKESTRFHAEGMSSAAFRHGPLEMVSPGLFAVVFSGDPATAPLNRKLAADIIAAGGRAAFVTETPGGTGSDGPFHLPSVPPRVRPILEILPIQMISLALSAIAGRQPGVFERATKITDTQ